DLNGLDTLIFTAGIGEHSAYIRSLICQKLEYLGVKIDEQKNGNNEINIGAIDSKVNVAVIPTNEEIMIARDVMNTVYNDK
ncbi:acetate kinase, partial [Lactobacillus sp. XV13L]|nr:acetate kinase [Lactobacillus sp. XV13L]